ncbi:MAG: hypothetical protein IPL88_01090 [Rhizobiales bacterium]|nr:hypothetical protein [Hyphomicrobiales bacterium]
MTSRIALALLSIFAVGLATEASAKGIRFSFGKAAAVSGARAAVKATRDKPAAPETAAPVLSPRLDAPAAAAPTALATAAPATPEASRSNCAARQGRMVGATTGGFCVLN